MNILNDTEHRIFLSAMAREKEICQKIDGDKIHDSTVKMLVPVCESIERKVDKAIPIPEGATNGDIIKAMFPDIIFDDLSSNYVTVENMDGNNNKTFIKDWWNAPYKGG